MPDIESGSQVQVPGSSNNSYTLKHEDGVYSCTCPAWLHQSLSIDVRTCKHLIKYRGKEAEEARVGSASVPKKIKSSSGKEGAPVLLAHKWDAVTDLIDWWISEKLDGVRAYWDGKTFYSRLGNEFFAPDWFRKGLPSTPLDGELWVARGEFQKAVSIVRKKNGNEEWKKVRYVAFDAPSFEGTFEERIAYLKSIDRKNMPHLDILDHYLCEGIQHLEAELKRIEDLGGEGLMLRQPKSAYEVGRSHTLLKVKTFHDDEGVVIEYAAGKGKHKGRVGALVLERPDGIRFNVGTGMSDAQREAPPEIGAVVTYRYQELTKAGVPRFPSFVGVRIDKDIKAPSLSAKSKASASKSKASGDVSSLKKRIAQLEAQVIGLTAERDALRKSLGIEAPVPNASAKVTSSSPTTSAKSVPGDAVVRYFEFEQGNSHKFWEVSIHGDCFTVRYGRVGAKGASKTKSFATEAVAQAEAEKLIAQKCKKGYEEQ